MLRANYAPSLIAIRTFEVAEALFTEVPEFLRLDVCGGGGVCGHDCLAGPLGSHRIAVEDVVKVLVCQTFAR